MGSPRAAVTTWIPGPRSGTCVHLWDTLAEEQPPGEQGRERPAGCVQPLQAHQGWGRGETSVYLRGGDAVLGTGHHCVSNVVMSRAAGRYGSWGTGGLGEESWSRGVTWTFVLMKEVRGARLRGREDRMALGLTFNLSSRVQHRLLCRAHLPPDRHHHPASQTGLRGRHPHPLHSQGPRPGAVLSSLPPHAPLAWDPSCPSLN